MQSSSCWSQALLVLVALVSQSNAFVNPAKSFASVCNHPSDSATKQKTTTELAMSTKPADKVVYGEESRKYRRTVYTHKEWVEHRSADRFLKNLSTLPTSGIYKNLAKEVVATTLVATCVVVYNCIVGGYTDFDGNAHPALTTALSIAGLPLVPFTLVTPSLGLLLGKWKIVLCFFIFLKRICCFSWIPRY